MKPELFRLPVPEFLQHMLHLSSSIPIHSYGVMMVVGFFGGRQGVLAVMTQHRRIGGQNDHLRQLGGGERNAKPQQFARFQRPAAVTAAGQSRAGMRQIEHGRRPLRPPGL